MKTILKNKYSLFSLPFRKGWGWANILLTLCLALGCSVGVGQNLVPNPSFEDTNSCPTNGWITHAANWQPFSSSPDYYNSCVPEFYGYSVPNNFTGTQAAASGQAYAGAISYIEQETNYSLNREILGNNLITPLTISQKYFVSFKVVAVPYANSGSSVFINKFGVLFSTVPYTNTDSTTIPPIQNFAHVYTDSIITDTSNWTTIFGSFVADSTYTYISVGIFFENNNIDTIHHTYSSFPGSYYLFDDICVSTDSSFCVNYIYTGVEEEQLKDNFNIYPNPITDYFQINQTYTEPYDLVIYNTLGQKLYEEKNISTDTKTINVNHFTKGLLIINIKSKNQSIIYKLLNL